MKTTVTQEDIDKLILASGWQAQQMVGKTTVVVLTLPNGFNIVESSSCVDPKNYDHNLGTEICMKKITDKLWELEGYRLQCELEDTPSV